MTNLIDLGAHRKLKITEQSIESYLQYLKLLNSSELLYEAKYLIKQVKLGEVSMNTKSRGKAIIAELVNRIEKKELLACQSLDNLQNQLTQTLQSKCEHQGDGRQDL